MITAAKNSRGAKAMWYPEESIPQHSVPSAVFCYFKTYYKYVVNKSMWIYWHKIEIEIEDIGVWFKSPEIFFHLLPIDFEQFGKTIH